MRKKREYFQAIHFTFLVSLLVIEVVGLHVNQIGFTSFDPDSDLVIFEAKSALV